jgi:hypothetical protein
VAEKTVLEDRTHFQDAPPCDLRTRWQRRRTGMGISTHA